MILTESMCLWKLDLNMTQILGQIQHVETWCAILFCHYKPAGMSVKTRTGDFQLLLQLWSLLGQRRDKNTCKKKSDFTFIKALWKMGASYDITDRLLNPN